MEHRQEEGAGEGARDMTGQPQLAPKGPDQLDWEGVDLVAAAREVLRFLPLLDARHDLGDKDKLSRVKVKYIKFLNLVRLFPKEYLAPPFEVEAFWQTHLIRPDMYQADCLDIFKEIIPHRVETDLELVEQGRDKARELWETTYLEDESSDSTSLPDELREKYHLLRVKEEDVVEDRQWFPYYKMYTSRVQDWETFLHASREGYLKFFHICAYDTGDHGMLEPTYAMDLIWHSHMLHPHLYYKHCDELANRLLVHVPWPKECTTEEMFAGLDRMDERWKAQFGVSMHDIAAGPAPSSNQEHALA